MNILVVSFADSDNLAIENVLRVLEYRGHKLTIFAKFNDAASLRMFHGLRAEIRNISELNNKVAKKFDVALCTNMTMGMVKLLDVYCFVYTSYIDDVFVTDGGDFLFTFRTRNLPYIDFRSASMAVGNPRNDTQEIQTQNDQCKRILYIDSGHLPFGSKGKQQIADLLLNVCERFPEYEICIKPRWLRENEHFTHKNTEHIYDVIERQCQGDIPKNLNMLSKHYDMQELIDSSVSVITLYSAAHLDVIMKDKGLLILSGWNNEDKWDMRNNGILKNQHDLYSESGCVVDYREAINYLPDGIKANETYKEKMYCCKSGASERIADVMEYVFENFILKGRYPKGKEYKYETYREEMSEDSSITMSSLKRERIREGLQTSAFLLQNRLPPQIDFTEYYNYLDEHGNSYALVQSEVSEYYRTAKILRDQIVIQHKDLLIHDPIDQAFLLRSLYDRKMWNEILEFTKNEILCIGPYHYYLGMIYRSRKKPQVALENFVEFVKDVNSRFYDKYPQEVDGIRDAYNFIFKLYDGENINPLDFAQLYFALFERGDELKTDYRLRIRAHNYLPLIAEKLFCDNPDIAYKCLLLYAKQDKHYNIEPSTKKIKELEKKLANSKAYCLGNAILWLPNKITAVFRKINRGNQCIKDHGKRYTILYLKSKITNRIINAIGKIKRKILYHSPFKILDTFRKKVLKGYQIYAEMFQKYGDNAYLFLSAIGTGDTYMHALFFKKYVEKRYPNVVPVMGVWANPSIEIANLFEIKDIIVLTADELRELLNLFMFIESEEIRMECLHYHIFYRHTGILSYIEGLHDFNYFSLSQAYLDISENEISMPVFDYDERFLEGVFNEKSLDYGKTVLFSPYAKTVKAVPVAFWNKLAKALIEAGFCVCTNSIGEKEPPIENTKAVMIPFQYTVPFLERAGAVIGLRSGLLDIVSTAKCVKVSLNTLDNYRRSPVCHISDSFALSAMYSQPEQYDLIYMPETENVLIEGIVEIISKKLLQSEERGKEHGYIG